ncbi:hypothetical protein BDR26DRAFT_855939 [Obelidium mucronatum]|nr:hypothetical protein BDR26DRAFT_855939 [Obelidium mucronatum]
MLGFGRRATVVLPLSFNINATDSVYSQPLVYSVNGSNAKVKTFKNFGTPHDILNDPVFQAAQRLKDGDRFIGVCEDIVDFVGTRQTPPTFFSIAVKPAPDQFSRTMWFHAVDAVTLEERPKLSDCSENNPFLKFDPNLTYQRPALLLDDNGNCHCDLAQGWSGWLIGVDTRKAIITTAWSAQGGSNSFANGGGAIWMSGAGPALDEAGNLYLTTGTGLNPSQPEFYPTASITKKNIPYLLNEAFVKFSLTSTGKATATDFFMPTNLQKYDQEDWDFGSGGPADASTCLQGSTGSVHSMFDLGQYVNATQNVYVGYFNTPTLWTGDGDGYLYVTVKASQIFALKWDPTTSSFSLAGHSTFTFSVRQPGGFNTIPGMPVVTSNGNTPGSAVVWATDVFKGLYAVSAVPDANGILQTLFNIPGFSQTGSGLVYVPTNKGTLLIYGKV